MHQGIPVAWSRAGAWETNRQCMPGTGFHEQLADRFTRSPQAEGLAKPLEAGRVRPEGT